MKISLYLKRFVILLLSIGGLVNIYACGHTQKHLKQREFTVAETMFLENMDSYLNNGTSSKSLSRFSIDDTKIYSAIKLINLKGNHSIRWDWYMPDGKMYISSGDYPVKTQPGKYHRNAIVWHDINIKGEAAENYPGKWVVNYYLDGRLVHSNGFDLINDQSEIFDFSKLKPIKNKYKNDEAYALFVGISKYKHMNGPEYSKNDADKLKQLLIKIGILKDQKKYVHTLYDEDATVAELRNEIDWLCEKGKINPNALLIFYFSGHGSPKLSDNNLSIVDGYLVPADSRIDKIDDYRAVRLSEIVKQFNQLKNQRVVAIIDACFLGKEKSVSNFKLPIAKFERKKMKTTKTIISATAKDRPAEGYPPGKLSKFTYFFIEGLMGNADSFMDIGDSNNWVDCYEAFKYAAYKIEALGSDQSPQIQNPSRIKLTRVTR